MILDEKVKIYVRTNEIEKWRSRGYDEITVEGEYWVFTKDFSHGSKIKLRLKCDVCGDESINGFFRHHDSLEKYGCYRCRKCANNKRYESYVKKEKKKYYNPVMLEKYGEAYVNMTPSEKVKLTTLENHGVDNISKLDRIKQKKKETVIKNYGENYTEIIQEKVKKSNLEKYGVENTTQLQEVKDKIKKTNLERYGVVSTIMTKENIEKSNKTKLDKYGTIHPMQLKEFQEKAKKTNLEKYGAEYHMQTEGFYERVKATNLEKYGVENVQQVESIKEKTKNTNLERYGNEHACLSKEITEKISFTRYDNIKKNYQKRIDPSKYLIKNIEDSYFIIDDLKHGQEFKIHIRNLSYRLRNNITISLIDKPLGNGTYPSSGELNLKEFIDSLNIPCESSNRKILKGKELDIFIPSKNIAIEYNGIYWHSEINVPRDYHQKKTLECNNQGIQLIHVFEDDWKYKTEIVKSIIKSKLGLLENKIYARTCQIKNVPSAEAMEFLENNHIQGGLGSSVKLGLYYKERLVSLMIFGFNRNKQFELSRFCSLLNTSVIGGASKLFEYFKKNYDYTSVVSYADLSISNGGLYEQLGFEYKGVTEPNYYWVIDDKRFHKFNFSKKKLVQQGFDKNKSENDIMIERGYYRFFSCGQLRYVYTK